MKKNFDNAISLLSVTEKELSLINKYSLTELKKEDVFAFNVILCDNEIDRDYECFTVDALKTLAQLFIGKTGILDHNMKAENQVARIFATETETVDNLKNSKGENYVRLKAQAYMLNNDKNKPLIDEILAGIKKEVSVNCSVSEIICSVCKKDIKKGRCEHQKGKNCHHILNNPTDAYEWSFVAVPAQKQAGTIKEFENEKETVSNENLVEIAEKYKNFLTEEIVKLSSAVSPYLSLKSISDICTGLDIDGLERLRKEFISADNKTYAPQLLSKKEDVSIDGFMI